MQDSNLNYLSDKEVAKLKNNFNQFIHDQVDSIIKDDMSKDHVKAIRKYAIARLLSGKEIDQDILQSISNNSIDQIKTATKKLADPLYSKEQRKRNLSASNSRFLNHGKGLLGTGKRRLYFPINDSGDKSEAEVKISEYLAKKGYLISDYSKGLATDGMTKQNFKIGKLIEGNLELLDEFKKDKTRLISQDALDRNKHLLVLSDRATDIVYMATRRSWEEGNCMRHDGLYRDKMPADIEHGILIAYLIKADDPKIYSPLSRILLKPYYNENGDTVYHMNKTYGLHDNGFINKAREIMEYISSTKLGLFSIPSKIYTDGAPNKKINSKKILTTIEFLDLLKVDYKENDTGQIFIEDDLDISNLDLKKLPNLSNVTIYGSFYCNNNKFKSLVGSPNFVGGDFYCHSNSLLVSLEGATNKIGKSFFCDKTPNIKSLLGLPEKFEMIYSDFGDFESIRMIPEHLLQENKDKKVKPSIKNTLTS